MILVFTLSVKDVKFLRSYVDGSSVIACASIEKTQSKLKTLGAEKRGGSPSPIL